MDSPPELLRVKQETIRTMRARGYVPVERDLDPQKLENELDDRLLIASPEHLESFITWARQAPNSIRQSLIDRDRTSARILLSQIYTHTTRLYDKCLVYFAERGDQKTIPSTETRVFASLVFEENCTCAILVCKVPLSSDANKEIADINVPREIIRRDTSKPNFTGCFIQIFLDEEFMYTPQDHVYVPEHRIMSSQEASDFLTTNRLKIGQLPQIATDDPIAKRLGARPGQIIEIKRETFIAETFLDHELCYRGVYLRAPEKKR
jgi:DNA-directed RNA polymerase subunit H